MVQSYTIWGISKVNEEDIVKVKKRSIKKTYSI